MIISRIIYNQIVRIIYNQIVKRPTINRKLDQIGGFFNRHGVPYATGLTRQIATLLVSKNSAEVIASGNALAKSQRARALRSVERFEFSLLEQIAKKAVADQDIEIALSLFGVEKIIETIKDASLLCKTKFLKAFLTSEYFNSLVDSLTGQREQAEAMKVAGLKQSPGDSITEKVLSQMRVDIFEKKRPCDRLEDKQLIEAELRGAFTAGLSFVLFDDYAEREKVIEEQLFELYPQNEIGTEGGGRPGGSIRPLQETFLISAANKLYPDDCRARGLFAGRLARSMPASGGVFDVTSSREQLALIVFWRSEGVNPFKNLKPQQEYFGFVEGTGDVTGVQVKVWPSAANEREVLLGILDGLYPGLTGSQGELIGKKCSFLFFNEPEGYKNFLALVARGLYPGDGDSQVDFLTSALAYSAQSGQ